MEYRKRTQIVIPSDVRDDLCSRFLLNIPSTEKADMVRLCFQIELAHWFYLDFYRPDNQDLPDCRFREFAKVMFESYPFLLKPPEADVDEVIDRWREYKRSVPTYGAVILDEGMQQVLLVQGFVVKASWGFPKGKVNKDEPPEDCAAREVLEETGFNIKPFMNGSEYVELRINEQLTRLYYVPGVPATTHFSPKTRNEIKSVKWFNVDDLPCHKKDMTPRQNLKMAPNNFFMVIPFVKHIRRWINSQKDRFSLSQSGSNTKHVPRTKADASSKSKVAVLGINHHLSDEQEMDEIRRQQDAEKQREYFAWENKLQLEKILRTKSGARSPQQSKKKNKLRQQPNNVPSPGHSYTSSRGRGRIIFADATPDCWKNYTFNEDALLKAINEFAPR